MPVVPIFGTSVIPTVPKWTIMPGPLAVISEIIFRNFLYRFVEKNRRDVEEKSEQLKAVSSLAALFAGFAVVTLTQFGFDADTVGIIWIAFYGVLTALVVGLMTISMVTCTLILGSILKSGKLYVNEEAEEDFMFRSVSGEILNREVYEIYLCSLPEIEF